MPILTKDISYVILHKTRFRSPPSEPHFLSFIIIRYQHYSDMKINSWDIDYLILSV